MELPHLGKHCKEPSCQQLDFLPMNCDCCGKLFCGDHITYSSHSCTESYKKDNKIPVCPLCNLPCPVRKGELADTVVSRHIESDCQSDPARERRKVYTNRCSKKGCKVKELIPVQCESCRLNFCLKHRHEQDHTCQGFQGSGKGVTSAGAAALFRFQKAQPSRPTKTSSKPSSSSVPSPSQRNAQASSSRVRNPAAISSLQGGLNEDEALAQALQQSMAQSGTPPLQTDNMTDQEREDFLLAQALSASEAEAQRSRSHQTSQTRQERSGCSMQ